MSCQTGKWLIKDKEYSQRLGSHKMHEIFSIAKSTVTVNLFNPKSTGRDILCRNKQSVRLPNIKHIENCQKSTEINVG